MIQSIVLNLKRSLSLFLLWGCLMNVGKAQLPEGFVDERVGDGWPSAVGFAFAENGDLFVWTKLGKVFVEQDGVRQDEPLLDISEEVATYGDHGLLGFALHPNFLNNGYFYVLYAVDRHHLLYHGTADYDPTANLIDAATIGRITRYTADPATNFTSLIPDSRKVLLGTSMGDGFPLLHRSHGVGSLVFGNDGTLMASCGDGGSYAGTDVGGDETGAYASQALADGIIDAAQNIGAFRSQSLHSINGKMLRLNPETGDGIPSNPFYQADDPRSPQSRIWVLGLRQPFRFTYMPGTGSHEPEDGDPGVFFVGDVGWAYWEELNVVEGAGQNFGWPIYEGMRTRWQFHSPEIQNPATPNPAYQEGSCNWRNFRFKDLLIQDTESPAPFFPNPCDPSLAIPSDVPHFVHSRPMVSYSNRTWNNEEQNTYVPGYDAEGKGVPISLLSQESPVQADTFSGASNIAGVFYTGDNFPAEYQMTYLNMDYAGWMKQFQYGPAFELLTIQDFSEQPKFPVFLAVHPLDGCIYYLNYNFQSEMRRICFGTDPAPTAVLESDATFGPSPLTVQFTGENSFDPEAQPISFAWEFGDGTSSTDLNPSHTFEADNNGPQSFTVRLTVTDTAGNSHKVEELISLNNTPPVVAITSFEDGDLYTTTGSTLLPLLAEVSDQEHSEAELSYAWQLHLHHNSHFHPEPLDTARETEALILGEGCTDETFWYRIGLTVTDGVGLSTYVEQELFPYCGETQTEIDTLMVAAQPDGVRLSWRTLRETPGTTFLVQWSEDRQHFATLGEATPTVAPGEYAFTDPNLTWSKRYYRIATRNPATGFEDFSMIREIDFHTKGAISLFPNPVSDWLTLEVQEVENAVSLQVFDLMGRLVMDRTWPGSGENLSWQVNMKGMAPGTYLYQVSDGRHLMTGKLVKDAF
ncbi:MAG: PQQ-dependent sugar dehydrogenase [Bacteroidota bacterium]